MQTVLSHAGKASRRRAVVLIESGRVKIDGKIVKEKGYRLDPDKHEIRVDDELLVSEEKKYYFLLNKPEGYICTASDTHGRRKITDIFTRIPARLYPVGRLDKDTTGVIIVTNDGGITHRLSHPRFEIDKEYVVTVKGSVSSRAVDRLKRGIRIDGKNTSPCEIETVRKNDSSTVLRLIIHEGRKRQIRRMFKEAGYLVSALDRTKYAGLTSEKLRQGEFRELTDREIKKLKGTNGI